MVRYRTATAFPGFAALLPCVGTAIVGHDPSQLRAPASDYLEQVARQRRRFLPLLANGDHLLETRDFLVRDGTIVVSQGGASLFRDDSHLTVHGALLLKPMFDPLFAP